MEQVFVLCEKRFEVDSDRSSAVIRPPQTQVKTPALPNTKDGAPKVQNRSKAGHPPRFDPF
jgi:hypothetical protein